METNELSPELLSIVGLNPWVGNDSASRQYMLTSHIGQRLVINGATERRVQTGIETEFAKYTFNVKIPCDATILKVIQKYPPTITQDIMFNTEIIVIYEDIHTGEVGCVSIPRFKQFHTYLGFDLKEKEPMSMLVPGQFMPKDTVLADSPAVSDVGGYMYGIELNTAFMSHPAVAEDGVVISRDILPLLSGKKKETRILEFGEDTFPINLYGTEENYKPFPDIGEAVRVDGILAAFREYDDDLSPAIMSAKDLMKIDHVFDDCVYIPNSKARVIDIKVFHNRAKKGEVPRGVNAELTKYLKATKTFYKTIIDTYYEIARNRKQKFGDDSVKLTPELHRLVVEGLVLTDDSSDKASSVLRKAHRQVPLDIYRVEITVEYDIQATDGFKLSGVHGNKGVICYIEEPENMPVDKNGVRADIIMDGGSVVNRMNAGVSYEAYMGSACNEVKFRLREIYGLERHRKYHADELEHIVESKLNMARPLLTKFYGLVNDRQAEYFSKLSDVEFGEHMVSVLMNGPYLHSPTDLQKPYTDIIRDIQREFKPLYDKVLIRDYDGVMRESLNKVRIGPSYFIVLEKIADSWSAVSSGKLQHFGVLSPSNKTEKHAYPYKSTAVRVMGETESRIYAAYTPAENAAEMMDRNNNPITHREVVRSIMRSDTPTNIPVAVDRKLVELGGSKPLQVINHILTCYGLRFKHFDGDK